MPFEKFTETGSGRTGNVQPQISLRKSGSIGINNAALEEFFDEDDEAVVMYYDEEENLRSEEGIDRRSSRYLTASFNNFFTF